MNVFVKRIVLSLVWLLMSGCACGVANDDLAR